MNPYESADDVKRASLQNNVVVACSMFCLHRSECREGNRCKHDFCSPRVCLVLVQSGNEQPCFDRGGGGSSSSIVTD